MTPRAGESPEEFRARRNAYWRAKRAANPAKNRATVKAWAAANATRKRARDESWRENNPERMRAVRKAWKERNRHRLRVHRATRRARTRAGGKLSANIIPRLLTQQGGCCAACAQALVAYHLDHVIPLARGGLNTDENVQLLCPSCNADKGALMPEEFALKKAACVT